MGRSSASRSASQLEPHAGVDPHEVARVAYELFERRGCEHGHDFEDWVEAERIVRERRRNGRR